jgi:hypothetical protein
VHRFIISLFSLYVMSSRSSSRFPRDARISQICSKKYHCHKTFWMQEIITMMYIYYNTRLFCSVITHRAFVHIIKQLYYVSNAYSLGFTSQCKVNVVLFADVLVCETLLKGISIKCKVHVIVNQPAFKSLPLTFIILT